MMTPLDKLKHILLHDCDIPTAKIELSTTLDSLDLDDLDKVELIMSIEEEFDVIVPDDKKFDTIDDIVKFVTRGI